MSGTSFATVNLTVWSKQPKDMQKALIYLLRQFDSRNPRITVKIQPHRGSLSLAQQIESEGSKQAADIFIADSQVMRRWMHKGMVKVLDASEINVDRIFPVALATMTDSRKNLWGVPIAVGHHLMLFLNKDLTSPTSFDSLEKLIKEAKNITVLKGVKGISIDLTNPYWFIPFIAGYNREGFLFRLPEVDKSALEKTFTLVHDMKFRWGILTENCDYRCGVEKFANSETAMLLGGAWELPSLKNKLGAKLDVAALPINEATGLPMRSLAYTTGIYFHRDLSKEVMNAGTKLAKYLLSDSAQLYLMKRSGVLSSVAPISRRVVVKKEWVMSKKLLALENSMPMLIDPKLDYLLRQIKVQLSLVLAGRQQPTAAASFIESAMREKYTPKLPK